MAANRVSLANSATKMKPLRANVRSFSAVTTASRTGRQHCDSMRLRIGMCVRRMALRPDRKDSVDADV